MSVSCIQHTRLQCNTTKEWDLVMFLVVVYVWFPHMYVYASRGWALSAYVRRIKRIRNRVDCRV